MSAETPQSENNDKLLDAERLRVLAALKSGQAEAKGFNDVYFADNESLLQDEEIMRIVAVAHPYVIGHISELNKDEDFVRKWFSCIQDSDKRKEVYRNARSNNLKISLDIF